MTQVGVRPTAEEPVVGDDLRARRLRLGLSAADLATALGVHPTSVQRWERGARFPGPATLYDLADTLGCDPRALTAFFDARRTPAPARERMRATGLRVLRSRRGASAEHVARALGVPASTVYNWEHGRVGLPLDLLGPLADWARLEPTQLAQVLRRPATSAPPAPRSALARARRRQGWSQDRLAQEVGVSRRLVGDWERGRRRPELFRIRLLARALDLPVARVAAEFDVPAPALLEPSTWSPGDLPDVLRVLRSWSGLRQRDVAERCGCSVEAVRGWERGRGTPRRPMRTRLEQLYRLPQHSLAAAAPLSCDRGCVDAAHDERCLPRHRDR